MGPAKAVTMVVEPPPPPKRGSNQGTVVAVRVEWPLLVTVNPKKSRTRKSGFPDAKPKNDQPWAFGRRLANTPRPPSMAMPDHTAAGSGTGTGVPFTRFWPSVVPNWNVTAVTLVEAVTPLALNTKVAA